MKKLIVLVALTAGMLTGCSEGQPLGPPKPPADANGQSVRVGEDGQDNYTFETVTINGMECILLKNRTYGGSKAITFDCDWDKESE